jgi:VWFA-related protein
MSQARRNKSYRHLVLLLFVFLLDCTFLSFSAISQSTDSEKPKLKDFGSSLKRIKWDSKQNASVEIKDVDDKEKSDKRDSDMYVIRVETALVAGDFLVLDRTGSPVHGLAQNDFLVTEDGMPQQVSMFSLGDSGTIPRSIVLIIDYSGSLSAYIQTSVEAAKTLVDQLGPKDRMAIVTDEIELLADFTKDKTELKSKLESLKEKAQEKAAKSGWYSGHSLQYSALLAVLKEAFDAEDVRPIIIFQTDGDELRILQPIKSDFAAIKKIARPFSIADVYNAALKSRATIYTVVPGSRIIGLPPDKQIERIKALLAKRMLSEPGRETLLKKVLDNRLEALIKQQSALAVLSIVTGGWIEFLEDPTQASKIYSNIFSDINRRYIIGYYPTNKEHDGKRRTINIEVKGHQEYTILGRKAYYAPGSEQ